MSIENEVKLVLLHSDSLEQRLFGITGTYIDIFQSYLNDHTRIRQIMTQTGECSYWFTFKRRLPDERNIEIETQIDADDFQRLLPFCENSLSKRRYSLCDGEIRWDIDFITWSSGQHYFVLAEAEMPIDQQYDPEIPTFLSSSLVFKVPRQDHRFSNRRLADENHVRTLVADLGLESI